MIIVVADNTILSNFANVQKPELLKAAFKKVVTVRAVLNEFEAGTAAGRIPSTDWSWLEIIELTADEKIKREELAQTLGSGEAECIALAFARGWIVLTDDRNARRTSQTLKVSVSGTLGALLDLVKNQTLTLVEADDYLELMKQGGYRCLVESLRELL